MKILMLFVLGFKKPRKPILGNVFSGVVESMGAKVSQFKLGDHVFGITGFKFGTYAEYLTIPENGTLTKMPVNASFDEAASLVFGGHTAAYFLNKMNIANTSNADILIIGATGSVGTSAIQIARYYGAKVTAVCSSNGKSIVENLGITDMIFYDKEDFLQHPKHFDLIFDAVGKTTKKQCKKILKKGGVYKTVGGWEMATESKKQLEFLKRMFEQGSLKAVIDRKYPFDEMVEAHRYVDTGRKKGNVVIQMVE
jgi:NADPH:quinone reductase-like Zn-dependent oxidoreductase